MKRLPSLPVEFPNMLYIFILWIKKKKNWKKGWFYAAKTGQAKLLPFYCGGRSALQTRIVAQEGTAGQETAPNNARPCARASQGYDSPLWIIPLNMG